MMRKRDQSPRRSNRLQAKLINWERYRRQWAVVLGGDKRFIHLPQQLIPLEFMTTLQMHHNGLRILDPVLSRLTQIQDLELSNNPITSLPGTINKLIHLSSLDLNDLPLKTLPDELMSILTLGSLRISHCPLSDISPKIGQLTKLNTLRLLGTEITNLPDELFSLPLVDILDISQNAKLTAVSPKICQLRSLQFLAIRKLPLISQIPWDLFMCSRLNHIIATDNPQLRKDPADGGLGFNPGGDKQTFSRHSWNNSGTCAWGLTSLITEWASLYGRRRWLQTLLFYFHFALECDVPILEAIWIVYPKTRNKFET